MHEGQHVEMVTMPDDVATDDRVEPGMKGVIKKLHRPNSDGSVNAWVQWEDGRSTELAIPPDVVTIGDDVDG